MQVEATSPGACRPGGPACGPAPGGGRGPLGPVGRPEALPGPAVQPQPGSQPQPDPFAAATFADLSRHLIPHEAPRLMLWVIRSRHAATRRAGHGSKARLTRSVDPAGIRIRGVRKLLCCRPAAAGLLQTRWPGFRSACRAATWPGWIPAWAARALARTASRSAPRIMSSGSQLMRPASPYRACMCW
jgi:hypothetical protein